MPSLATTPMFVSNAGTNTNVLTTPSFTPANGELLVVKAVVSDPTVTMGAPTGGSQTYTSQLSVTPGGFKPNVQIWTAIVSGSPGSMTVSSTPTGSAYHSLLVERWVGAQLGVTPAVGSFNDATGAANASLTSVGHGSVVTWAAGDLQSLDPATRAYLASATENGLNDGHLAADGVHYYAWQNAASPGTQSFGLSLPTGMKYTIGGLEILDLPITWIYGYDVRIG